MKYISTALVMLLCWTAAADELELRWGGRVQSDVRFRIQAKETGAFYKKLELPAGVARNENIFKAKLDALYGSYAGVVDVDFVWLGYPESLDGIADLSDRGFVDPYYLQVHALYLEAADFIFEGLDLRIGQQQIKWGVGDQFNPTNTLNPNDVEDVLLFGEQMANLMIKLDYAVYDMWTVSGVLVPIFQPALPTASAPSSSSRGFWAGPRRWTGRCRSCPTRASRTCSSPSGWPVPSSIRTSPSATTAAAPTFPSRF